MHSFRYLSRIIIGMSFIMLFLTSCGEAQIKPASSEDTMIAFVLGVDMEKREIHLDIGDWVNRNNTTGKRVDIRHSQTVSYDETTIFDSENGRIDPQDLKKGQKLVVSPTPASETKRERHTYKANKIFKATMSKQERWKGFLSSGDGFHTVVMYEEGTRPPFDELDFEKHVPISFKGGIWWKTDEEGTVVDYKQEFGFEKLPVILVFDKDGLVFQTDSMEKLKIWSDEGNVADKIAEKLIVLKRVGTENKYDDHKEITDNESILNIKAILKSGEWEKVKFSKERPPDYKLHFEPTDGRKTKAILYDVWFTNGFAQIYIDATNLYKKLSKEDSSVLQSIVS
ncbi:hypothetical protein [Paenibacillus sp. GCM10027626]|uniref:hypothetical protein n=1 Tax=Paenibacillus sp. GCM10027626 TaxID=3273411 RepID=UPI003628699B